MTFISYTFLKTIFILSNNFYGFLLLNYTFSILFCEEPNLFHYYFVAIDYCFFIIINATVVQIVFCDRKGKSKVTVKNKLSNNCNTMLNTVKIIFQLNQCWIWRYFKKGIVSIFFLQYFIWEFSSWFTLLSYMIQCHTLSKFNPIICF